MILENAGNSFIYSVSELDRFLSTRADADMDALANIADSIATQLKDIAGHADPKKRRRVWYDVNDVRPSGGAYVMRSQDNTTVYALAGWLSWLTIPVPGSTMNTYQPVPDRLLFTATRVHDPDMTEDGRKLFGALALAIARLIAEGPVAATQDNAILAPIVARFPDGSVSYSYQFDIPVAGLHWLPRERGFSAP